MHPAADQDSSRNREFRRRRVAETRVITQKQLRIDRATWAGRVYCRFLSVSLEYSGAECDKGSAEFSEQRWCIRWAEQNHNCADSKGKEPTGHQTISTHLAVQCGL